MTRWLVLYLLIYSTNKHKSIVYGHLRNKVDDWAQASENAGNSEMNWGQENAKSRNGADDFYLNGFGNNGLVEEVDVNEIIVPSKNFICVEPSDENYVEIACI